MAIADGRITDEILADDDGRGGDGGVRGARGARVMGEGHSLGR